MMTNNKNSSPIKLGLDANIIIYLSRIDKNANDLDRKVVEALENGALHAEDYQTTNFRDLPPLLRQEYVGELTTGNDGKDHYGYLEELYELLGYIKAGVIQPIMGPTVSYELKGQANTSEFINKYVTEIVVDKDDTEFWRRRKELATRYAKAGAIDLEPNAVNLTEDITADACLTAEFSLFGVNFVTANLRHLVHKYSGDFKRRDRIMAVNHAYGLNYTISHADKTKYAPTSFPVANYLTRLRIYKKRGANPVLYFNDINLDQNNNYMRRYK